MDNNQKKYRAVVLAGVYPVSRDNSSNLNTLALDGYTIGKLAELIKEGKLEGGKFFFRKRTEERLRQLKEEAPHKNPSPWVFEFMHKEDVDAYNESRRQYAIEREKKVL